MWSLSIFATSLTTSDHNGVLFVLGALRGLGGSSSEFLMDAKLIAYAATMNDTGTFSSSSVPGILQSLAATYRSVGSSLGGLGVFFFLLLEEDQGVDAFHVRSVLIFTSLLVAIASTLMCFVKEDSSRFEEEGAVIELNPNASLSSMPKLKLIFSSSIRYEIFAVISGQFILLWVLGRSLIPYPKLWIGILLALLALFIFSILILYARRQTHCSTSLNNSSSLYNRKIALFLLLFCSTPTLSYTWGSFLYYLYKSSPILLQVLAIAGSIGSSIGSLLYNRLNHLFDHLNSWYIVRWCLVAGCLAKTASSMGYLPVASWDINDDSLDGYKFYAILLPLHVIGAIVQQMAFLPLVVLATMAVDGIRPLNRDGEVKEGTEFVGNEKIDHSSKLGECEKEATGTELASLAFSFDHHAPEPSLPESTYIPPPNRCSPSTFQYGVYVACIDFGDQIGSWASVPIVARLGLSTTNWGGMREFTAICNAWQVLSLIFLGLLRGIENTQEEENNMRTWERSNSVTSENSGNCKYGEVV